MQTQEQQQRIEEYINAYNNFDVEGMLATLHPDIAFKNISNSEVNMVLNGTDAFREQAQKATQFFSQRKQMITDISFTAQEVEISIDYLAVLAVDLPNGLKAGETLHMKGKSIFRFKDKLIVSIEDIS